MTKSAPAQTIGRYLVTPLTRLTETGLYAASVSIRRGMHDRIYRFTQSFTSDAAAMQYALTQARSMVLANRLA
ncbi:MAG: hypothetical protein J0H69_11165 [Burkholderiales bacterium]|jgi:hypothetical protein|nr:hypothetical protein [Burkholderiales bacterium]